MQRSAVVTRDLEIGQIAEPDGVVRVTLVLPAWEDFVSVALDEILALPVISPNVARRIARLLDDLAARVPPDWRACLEARRGQVHVRA